MPKAKITPMDDDLENKLFNNYFYFAEYITRLQIALAMAIKRDHKTISRELKRKLVEISEINNYRTYIVNLKK